MQRKIFRFLLNLIKMDIRLRSFIEKMASRRYKNFNNIYVIMIDFSFF